MNTNIPFLASFLSNKEGKKNSPHSPKKAGVLVDICKQGALQYKLS